jgi:hypothetical protein
MQACSQGWYWIVPFPRIREALERVMGQIVCEIGRSKPEEVDRRHALARLLIRADPGDHLLARAGAFMAAPAGEGKRLTLEWFRRLDQDAGRAEPEGGLEEQLMHAGLLAVEFPFHRADGNCLCPDCGQPYWRHALASKEETGPLATLHELCDGTLVKL